LDDNEDEDPLISIPVYGRYFQKTNTIELPRSNGKWEGEQKWINETNLDRRYRIPAAFGTNIVQENQEEYMQECWEQAGEIREANENLRMSRTSNHVSANIKERHIDPLNDERFTLITHPFITII